MKSLLVLPLLVLGSLSQTQIAQAETVQIEDFSINSVPGWNVTKNKSGMTLVMEEMKDPAAAPVYDKPNYLRNLSVVKIGHASPIDELRGEEFKAQLTKHFEKDGLAKDFKIAEAKMIKLADGRDGFAVFNSFTMNNFQLMQMHVLVSNDVRQYHLTYTDLAERFGAKDGMYDVAWQAISSVKLAGETPKRADPKVIIVGSSLVLVLIAAGALLMRRRARKQFSDDAEVLFEDFDGDSEIAKEVSSYGTIVNGWNIKARS